MSEIPTTYRHAPPTIGPDEALVDRLGMTEDECEGLGTWGLI
ncbi:MAG: hypothetical protein P8M79_00895 [Alphaproteobacteria bacterium]|nr:hypothetical protein [Alphaproteobacteria bacterium]